LHEVWDVLEAMKAMVDDQTAISVLEENPQLVEAFNLSLKRLGLAQAPR
jgi:hypothetical protein